ncbi:MAG TPA: hypothetical protein VHQ87_16870, partial [Rhizobacter sp.]|nr:hypothetical protein [Rhizobacter sp.]
MSNEEPEASSRVLHPVDRVTEVIFGLLMAMTFTGTLSVASNAQEEVRTMMIAALGCNLAWGLADAVMYLVRSATDRTRHGTLLRRLSQVEAPAGQALIAEALPQGMAEAVGKSGLEGLRQRLLNPEGTLLRPQFGMEDVKGAVGVFVLVVLSTFPLVIPFMLIKQAALATRVSNAVALVMLYIAGAMLARYAGGTVWKGGIALALTGAVLVAAIVALG